jgi:riboflavin kinase/FMN adenylyltransferase
MLILLDSKDNVTKNSVCGIGSFDGVHRGHQKIVDHMNALAGREKKVGIITFDPLPFFVLKKAPTCCLTPKQEKEKIFEELGVDFIYYFKFTKEFAQATAHQFVESIAEKIEPSIVVVGENFHFGKDRAGTAERLRTIAQDRFGVHIMTRLSDEGTISSTRIRELLLLGNVRAANNLLGREYALRGEVTKGKGKGQKIGFPTINIRAPKNKLMPLDGVYKVKVMIEEKEFLGALFCRHDLIEIYIINFSGDLYAREVSVKFAERIRGIEHFSDDEALKSAIARDVEKIKARDNTHA